MSATTSATTGRRYGLKRVCRTWERSRSALYARLRILDDIRVSRTRVLRVMRAQGLLSPHRGRQGEMQAHEGTIGTSAPDVMWGTDGVRVVHGGGRRRPTGGRRAATTTAPTDDGFSVRVSAAARIAVGDVHGERGAPDVPPDL